MEKIPLDVSRNILSYLDDESLAYACIINKNFNKNVCNQTFWINKIRKSFPELFRETGKDSDLKLFYPNGEYYKYYKFLSELIKNKNPDEILDEAINTDRIDLAIIAINRGANPNKTNVINLLGKYEYSLTRALDEKAYNVFRFLLLNGANPNLSPGSVFSKTLKTGDISLMKLLLETNFIVRYPYLRLAVVKGDIPVVRLLLNEKSNEKLNEKLDINYNNSYLLSQAILEHNKEMINFLIDNGSDIPDAALTLATHIRYPDIVKILLKRGANPFNRPAITSAKEHNQTEILNMILEKQKALEEEELLYNF